jgi:hypothetical protein
MAENTERPGNAHHGIPHDCYTAAEAAAVLGCSYRNVMKLCETRRLGHIHRLSLVKTWSGPNSFASLDGLAPEGRLNSPDGRLLIIREFR